MDAPTAAMIAQWTEAMQQLQAVMMVHQQGGERIAEMYSGWRHPAMGVPPPVAMLPYLMAMSSQQAQQQLQQQMQAVLLGSAVQGPAQGPARMSTRTAAKSGPKAGEARS